MDSQPARLDEAWQTFGPEALRYATVLVGPDDAHDVTANAFLRVTRSTSWGSIVDRRAYFMRATTRYPPPTAPPGATTRPIQNDPDGMPIVWRHDKRAPDDVFANLALVGGTLSYDTDHDCFMFGDVPVVWPAGTKPSSEPFGVRLASGTVITLGSSVSGAGGYYKAADEYDIPAACLPASGEVAVFNPNDQPTIE